MIDHHALRQAGRSGREDHVGQVRRRLSRRRRQLNCAAFDVSVHDNSPAYPRRPHQAAVDLPLRQHEFHAAVFEQIVAPLVRQRRIDRQVGRARHHHRDGGRRSVPIPSPSRWPRAGLGRRPLRAAVWPGPPQCDPPPRASACTRSRPPRGGGRWRRGRSRTVCAGNPLESGRRWRLPRRQRLVAIPATARRRVAARSRRTRRERCRRSRYIANMSSTIPAGNSSSTASQLKTSRPRSSATW